MAKIYVEMTKFHVTVGGNSENTLENEFLSKSIFKRIGGVLEKTRDNLTSTRVKVPLTVTSIFF
jgi:hypothetical protein